MYKKTQWGPDRNMEFIWWLANRLTSYDEEMHKEILEDFFTDDAKYVSLCLLWLPYVLASCSISFSYFYSCGP